MNTLTDLAGWRALERTYDSRGLVVALGAGVSVGCGLPNWEELLKKLAVKCLGDRGGSLFEDLKADGYSLPAIAGIIRAQDPDQFPANVREALYGHDEFKEYYPNGVTKRNRRSFISFIHGFNPTLRAIAAICARKREGRETYTINPRIHALVNFNVRNVSTQRSKVQAIAATNAWYTLSTLVHTSAGIAISAHSDANAAACSCTAHRHIRATSTTSTGVALL